MSTHQAYILLGSNLGNRKQFLQKATHLIAQQCGKILKTSAIYETAAWGNTAQSAFLNQVILLQTNLEAEKLMRDLLKIETDLGRVRTQKFGPRTIDLDILFYDHLIQHTNLLTLPHPAIQDRRFVLVPLVEIAPRKLHPVYQKTVNRLLKECTDQLEVKKR